MLRRVMDEMITQDVFVELISENKISQIADHAYCYRNAVEWTASRILNRVVRNMIIDELAVPSLEIARYNAKLGFNLSLEARQKSIDDAKDLYSIFVSNPQSEMPRKKPKRG